MTSFKIISYLCTLKGVLAQLVERQVRNLEVRGSTPLCSTPNSPAKYAGLLFYFSIFVDTYHINISQIMRPNVSCLSAAFLAIGLLAAVSCKKSSCPEDPGTVLVPANCHVISAPGTYSVRE